MFKRPSDVARLGLLASAAIVLFVFEALAPRPLPWMKLGLGNLPVLLSLLSFGSGPALAVTSIKLVVGGLLSGGFAGPAFVIGGGAGLVSLLVMALIKRYTGRLFSVVGLSIWGALAHQLCQLINEGPVHGIELLGTVHHQVSNSSGMPFEQEAFFCPQT